MLFKAELTSIYIGVFVIVGQNDILRLLEFLSIFNGKTVAILSNIFYIQRQKFLYTPNNIQ